MTQAHLLFFGCSMIGLGLAHLVWSSTLAQVIWFVPTDPKRRLVVQVTGCYGILLGCAVLAVYFLRAFR